MFCMSTISKNQPNGYVSGFEKWVKEMAEVKWFLFNVFGYTSFAWSVLFITFANVDIFTRIIVSFVGTTFLITKLFVYIISFMDKRKMVKLERLEKELGNIEKELNNKEKELNLRQRELEIYEREQELIKSFTNL